MANLTKLANLINPEVMGDMISATLPKKIKFSPLAHIDTTLVGRAGDTITIPKYAYIGDAEDVAEGVAMGTTVLTASSTQATVKKAGKAVELTDESLLSGYGDPANEATRQIALAIASKVDTDCYEELCKASLTYDGSAAPIGYEGVVKANTKFEDEVDEGMEKVIFIHPSQEETLLLDENFKSKDKYPLDVIMNGVIGKIAGCQAVKSKKVKDDGNGNWLNPIVIVATADPNEAPEADGAAPEDAALTIYMKRNTEVETDRDILAKTTVISADEHYTAKLTNESKVVLAKFKK
jgi:N4-gp56 family major capsid protein